MIWSHAAWREEISSDLSSQARFLPRRLNKLPIFQSLKGNQGQDLQIHVKILPPIAQTSLPMFNNAKKSATALAQSLATDFPPSLQHLSGRKAVDMFQRAMAQHRLSVQELQKEQKMGLIKRIVFARALQKEFFSIGYNGALVHRMMSESLSALTFDS